MAHGSDRYEALYARYSSHAQDDSTSVAVQIDACERAAGKSLARFIDLAKTGRTSLGRPELARLITEAEAGRISKLYVYKFDRLGRSARTHALVEDLEDCGVEVISVTEGTNSLARGVQLVVAADYSRQLAARTRDGLIQRHKEGCWTGGPPPYGYKIVGVGVGAGVKKLLAIDQAEAAVVRSMFDVYLGESVGYREIARRLRLRGVRTRRGRPWCGGSVRNVLINRVLVGEVAYLRRTFRLDKASGKRRPVMTGKESVRRDEALRLVDDVTFARAQAKMAACAVAIPRGVRHLRAFTGRIVCASCGCSCYARKNKNARAEYFYYVCGRRASIGVDACPNMAAVREDKLLARVRAAIAGVFQDKDAVVAEVLEQARAALELGRAESARLRSEISAADRELAGLARLLVDSDVEPGARRSISRQIAEREERRDTLIAALEGAAERAVDDMEALAEECRAAFEEARADFASIMTPAQLNRFVAEVVGPMEIGADGVVAQKKGLPVGADSPNSGGAIWGLRGLFWGRFGAAA